MIIKPKTQEVTEENIYLIAAVIKQKSCFNKVKVLTESGHKYVIYEFAITTDNKNYQINYFDGRESRNLKTSDEVYTD
jgi:hypothetical protein